MGLSLARPLRNFGRFSDLRKGLPNQLGGIVVPRAMWATPDLGFWSLYCSMLEPLHESEA